MNTTEQFEVILHLAGTRFSQLDATGEWKKGERASTLAALRKFSSRTRYMRQRLDASREARRFRQMIANQEQQKAEP